MNYMECYTKDYGPRDEIGRDNLSLAVMGLILFIDIPSTHTYLYGVAREFPGKILKNIPNDMLLNPYASRYPY